MKPSTLTVAVVVALTLVAGLSTEARASGEPPGAAGCLVSQPSGSPANGTISLDIGDGYDPFGSGQLTGDVDATLMLMRSGKQVFFRLFVNDMTVGNPDKVMCDLLTSGPVVSDSVDSAGTVVVNPPDASLERSILKAFGFLTDGTYKVLIARGSIADTDGVLPIPGTGTPPRYSATASLSLYITKK